MENYDEWNNLKKKISNKNIKILFKEGDIWWMSLGLNIGEEMYGKDYNFSRPVIVFKKLTSKTCIVLPLSTKQKQGTWYFSLKIQDKIQTISLHQIRFVSVKRFIKKIAQIPESDFELIRKAVENFYGFS